jgi:hypothetical protein
MNVLDGNGLAMDNLRLLAKPVVGKYEWVADIYKAWASCEAGPASLNWANGIEKTGAATETHNH